MAPKLRQGNNELINHICLIYILDLYIPFARDENPAQYMTSFNSSTLPWSQRNEHDVEIRVKISSKLPGKKLINFVQHTLLFIPDTLSFAKEQLGQEKLL